MVRQMERCQLVGVNSLHSIYFPHPRYYRGAAGALLVFDIAKRETFMNIGYWLEEIRRNTDANFVVFLVGNNCHLQDLREVSYKEAREYAGNSNSRVCMQRNTVTMKMRTL